MRRRPSRRKRCLPSKPHGADGGCWALHSSSDGSAPNRSSRSRHPHRLPSPSVHGGAACRQPHEGCRFERLRSAPSRPPCCRGAQVAKAPEPAPPPQPSPQASAHAQMSQTMDAMAQDLMKQAMQPPKPQGLDAAMAARPERGHHHSRAGQAQPPGAAPAPPLSRSPPWSATRSAACRCRNRPARRARRRRLQARGAGDGGRERGQRPRLLSPRAWQPRLARSRPVPQRGDRTIQSFTSPEGPAVLTLERKGRDISVALLSARRPRPARPALMPKAGQASSCSAA